MTRKNGPFAALIMVGLVAVGGFARGAPRDVSVMLVSKSEPSVFEFGQWQIDLGRLYDNPFDPDLIAVDATFIGPDDKTLTMPAFWDKNDACPNGAFFVRFAPPSAGRWTLTVTAVDASGRRTSAVQTCDVAKSDQSDRPGFVRVAENHRYLTFDSGKSYFPIGLNLAWPSGEERDGFYDRTFKTLAENGGNFARVWMADPKVMLETDKTGPLHYNLRNAHYYDQILDSAQRHGIGVMLCFLNHRELLSKDMWGAAGWEANVFNAKNGGPATQPFDFFTSDAAIGQFKARLRYIVARYAAYMSVTFWELFNEQEGTQMKIPIAWDTDMAAYIRSIDPYQHLVTTSSVVPDGVWQSPEIAITQTHTYGNGSTVDLVSPVIRSQAERERFNKPHLFAEFGIDYHGGDYTFDPTGKATAFHNALWSVALSGSAGSAMYWWWDNYIESKNLWHEFKPLANFTSDVDWAHCDFKPLRNIDVHRASSGEPFVDLSLPAAGNWGVIAKSPLSVPIDGRLDRPLPKFFCGPNHKDLYAPLTLSITLTEPSQLILRADRVSDYATLRVSVDAKPLGDLFFSALPNTPGTAGSKIDQESRFYRADIKQPTTLPAIIPTGRHDVKLDLIAGDWLTMDGVTFTHALDPRYADLATVGIQDPVSKESLLWVYDTRSNWKADQSGDPPPQAGVEVTIPHIDSGDFAAIWYDTRRGTIVQRDRVSATDGKLVLKTPTFTRDIALKLHPAMP